ncbi:hypothetical protein LCGC14_0729790 [marine sediment metagenome]|uniref:LSM domain-containing protein n=1 Tax=marine sediment metagenome TaxID=412755 RepID=A0A0F9TH50_9ZZZZ
MDVSNYLEKYVKVDLQNGFYYEGLVIGIDSDSITLRDKTGKIVTIQVKFLTFIREVDK